MRALEVVAFGAFLAACGGFARALWARARPAPDGRWEAYHRFDGTRRRVYVRRGDELEPVGDVLTTAPDYDERFMRLMETARERAAVLNSER